MQKLTRSEQIKLDTVLRDESVPQRLRLELENALAVLERVTQLHAEALNEARSFLEDHEGIRLNEPARVLDLVQHGTPPTLEEILETFHAVKHRHAVAVDREHVLRRAVSLAESVAISRTFSDHADSILRTTASAVVAGTLSPGLEEAWRRVSGHFRWHLPAMHALHQFGVLKAPPVSPAMRKVWECVDSERFTVIESGPGTAYLRVSEYWPELAEAPRELRR